MRGAHISHSGAQQSSWLAWQMAKPHEVPPDYQQLFTQLAAASADNTVALPLPVFLSIPTNPITGSGVFVRGVSEAA